MRRLISLFALLALPALAAFSQMQDERPPGQMLVGKVTAVTRDSITIAPMKGGDPFVIKISENTRILKQRQPAQLSDVKVGDGVFCVGQLNGNTMNAAVVNVVSPEMLERLQARLANGGTGPAAQFKPEDWGKTFIAGQVKAINETTLTIARPNDQQTMNIEVDENTSFKKGGESVTLADIKPDDFIFGPGEVKNGVFVAKELRVGGGRMFMGGQGPGAGQNKPDAEKPAGGDQKPQSDKPATPPQQ